VGNFKCHNDEREDETKTMQYTWYREAIKLIKESIGVRDLPEKDSTDFKSITRKSLNYEGSRYQDTLIQIASMCQENSLTDFVGNLKELSVLLNSMSPSVEKLLEKTFSESRYTKNIKNLDLKIRESLKVVPAATSFIS